MEAGTHYVSVPLFMMLLTELGVPGSGVSRK